MGYITENKDTYDNPQTSLKTIENIDDEAFAAHNDILRKTAQKLTGKKPTGKQKEDWRELAELLVMELEIAAARTSSISNVPAFLTEHLRRRLFSKPAELKQKANKPLQVAKNSESELPEELYEAEPLTEQARETVLKTMRDYLEKGQKEFVTSLEVTYTAEDWKWLTAKLENKP